MPACDTLVTAMIIWELDYHLHGCSKGNSFIRVYCSFWFDTHYCANCVDEARHTCGTANEDHFVYSSPARKRLDALISNSLPQIL
jgi:hypothetical protein